jgi:hypothetical protein
MISRQRIKTIASRFAALTLTLLTFVFYYSDVAYQGSAILVLIFIFIVTFPLVLIFLGNSIVRKIGWCLLVLWIASVFLG